MRRMTTNKQINFIDKASKAIEVNNLEEVIKIPFPYINLEAEEENLQKKVEEIDFETHTMSGTSGITYYANEDLDKEKGYTAIVTDENISFPETISTVSALAKWLSENLPLDENAYVDESYIPQSLLPDSRYDFGDSEFEFVNNVLYVIGYAEYSPAEYPVISIGSNDALIPEAYIYSLKSQSVNSASASVSNILVESISKRPDKNYIYIQSNTQLHPSAYLQVENFYTRNITGQGDSAHPFSLKSAKGQKILLRHVAPNEKITGEISVDNIVSIDSKVYATGETGSSIEVSPNSVSMFTAQENTGQISFYADYDSNTDEFGSVIHLDTDGISIDPDYNGKNHHLTILHLPTSDPQVANALWNDNGVLKISSGS